MNTENIDLLMTASCYKSAASALRMINSLHYIDGNVLLIITSPRMEDLSFIRQNIPPSRCSQVILFMSKIDNMYDARNWGFIWAYMNGYLPKFYGSMDDDIEFTENSRDILTHLENHHNYAVTTFNQSEAAVARDKSAGIHDEKVAPWINGDSMFTRYEDNLYYGLPDCLPDGEPSPLCTESEYQQRLAALSGLPIVVKADKVYYIHHFRDTPDKIALRDIRITDRIHSGIRFFREKYHDIPLPKDVDINKVNFHGALRAHIALHPEQAKRHLLYEGLFTDYVEIYSRIANLYTQVFV